MMGDDAALAVETPKGRQKPGCALVETHKPLPMAGKAVDAQRRLSLLRGIRLHQHLSAPDPSGIWNAGQVHLSVS